MQKSVEEGSGRIKSGRCKEDGDEKLWRRTTDKSRGNSYRKPRLFRSCSAGDGVKVLGYDALHPGDRS